MEYVEVSLQFDHKVLLTRDLSKGLPLIKRSNMSKNTPFYFFIILPKGY